MSILEESITLKSYNYSIYVDEKENHKSDGLDANWVTFLFYGKDFNVKLANSIRRACSNNIPSYAIPQEQITININTTVAFNNDYMKLRLSQLPVYGIDPEIYFLSEKYWNKDTVNYADNKREKHPKEKTIEYYLKTHNNSSMISNVTTNDLKMFIDGEEIHPYNKKYPILLIKLRPNDKFECHMKGALGVGDRNVIWSGARNVFYDENEKKEDEIEYSFTVEGNGQVDEYDAIVRSCKFLIKKYNDLKDDLEKKIKSKEILPRKVIYFKLDKEDYTMGEPLNYEFQNHNDIIMSGLSKPDHLVRTIQIRVEAKDGVESPLKAMLECIDIVIKKISHIGYIVSNLKIEIKSNKKKQSKE